MQINFCGAYYFLLYQINGMACVLRAVQGDDGIGDRDAGYTKKSLSNLSTNNTNLSLKAS